MKAFLETAPRRGWLQQVDARSLLVGLLVVIFCVVSHGKYHLLPLLPYALFPLVVVAGGQVALAPLLVRLLLLAPLALLEQLQFIIKLDRKRISFIL